jgi:hypothetical protein
MRSPDFFFPCPNPQQFRPVRRTPSGRTHRHSSIRPAGRPTATSQPSGAAPSAAKGIGFIRASGLLGISDLISSRLVSLTTASPLRYPLLLAALEAAASLSALTGPVDRWPPYRERGHVTATRRKKRRLALASSGAVPIRSRIPDPTAHIRKKKGRGATSAEPSGGRTRRAGPAYLSPPPSYSLTSPETRTGPAAGRAYQT